MATIDANALPGGGGPSVHACFEEAYGQAIDAAAALRRFRSRVEAEQAELIELSRRTAFALPEALVDASVHVRHERLEAAARAHVAEVATSFHLSESHAAGLVDESRRLVNELPATLAALKDGRFATEHARVVVAESVGVPPEVRSRFDEEAAVLACSCTPPQLRRRLRALRERLHPETLRERHRRCRDGRGVWVDGDRDGMATLHLHVPAPEAFGAFDRIDRAARSVRQGASAADDPRRLRQIRADVASALLLEGETCDEAHAEAAIVGAGAPSVGRRGDGPHRGIRPGAAEVGAAEVGAARSGTAVRATSAGSAGRPTLVPRGIRAVVAVTVPVLTLLGRSDESALLDGYGPIDAETARQLAGTATGFTRILTDPHTGATRGVDRRSYRPPAELRRALAHRDETCRFSGCLRTARSSELDHTVPWQRGGATDADNLAHLCTRHHRLRHLTTWQPTNRGGGEIDWRSPAGRVLTVEAPRPQPPPF